MKTASEERVALTPPQIAERIVDDYFSVAPQYRIREKLVKEIAAELAAHEALVDALRLTEPLLMDLCTMALRKELHDFLPRGEETLEQITAWLQSSAVSKARAALKLVGQ